jgi:hypothetical protein
MNKYDLLTRIDYRMSKVGASEHELALLSDIKDYINYADDRIHTLAVTINELSSKLKDD